MVAGGINLLAIGMISGPGTYGIRTDLRVYLMVCWCATQVGAWIIACARIERANRAASPKLCWTCGYDLTGNITGICSECGTPIHPDQCPSRAEEQVVER